MKMVKWGVLGTASIARGCTIPGMQKAENCELYGIAGRNKEKTEQFQKEFGFVKAFDSYDALLADPAIQAVYIPLPNQLHYEWCMKAIQAGKHVLCEKPLAPTQAQAKELFAAAKAAGVHLMEAFAYLQTPYIDSLQEDIKRIGQIKYLESAFMVQSWDPSDIRMHKETYGGAFYDLGCYCLSLMVWLLGEAPTQARAISEYTQEGVDLFTTAYLKFPGDIRASINCGMFFGRERSSRMDRLYIHGSKGCIKSPVEFNQAGDLTYLVSVDGVDETKTIAVKHNYQLEVEQLGRCIEGVENPRVSAEFSVRNAGAIDMVLEAMGYFE